MAGSSYLPLSLLAKGIGQMSKNGHERLDVYLEPEDYYNLQSHYQQLKLQSLHKEINLNSTAEKFESSHSFFPLHKTFVTRKGALLLFSEELAKKSLEEEKQKFEENYGKAKQLKSSGLEPANEQADITTDTLKTCNDLSWAILSYGTKPEYRKKGDELFLRFIHEAKGNTHRRVIRPGFSPKRYISTWSKNWDEGMLQKLRSEGMVSDKTLYRQNPLLPHLYKFASYNLSSNPPPYRVTKSMLLPPGHVSSYEFYRANTSQPHDSSASWEAANKAPPPSQLNDPIDDPTPLGTIQAVRYHETGEIQEVTYSELKPQEKQEILAELLIAAHEHQQHIRGTLELVMSTYKNQANGSDKGQASSASSELMADMQRAILSLIESPVRQQMKERQKMLREQEERLEDEQRHQKLKEERRQKRRQERKVKKEAERTAFAQKLARENEVAEELANVQSELKKESRKMSKELDNLQNTKTEERRLREERKRKRREEREARRKEREEKVIKGTKVEEASEEAAEVRSPLEAHTNVVRDLKPRYQENHKEEEEDETKKEQENKIEGNVHFAAKHRKPRSAEEVGALFNGSMEQQPRVHLRTSQPSESGSTKQSGAKRAADVVTILSREELVEIQQPQFSTRPALRRRDAGLPIVVPVNTPAVETWSSFDQHRMVEYEEILIVEEEPHKTKVSPTLFEETKSGQNKSLQDSHEEHCPAPRSIVSSHPSVPKQILFELPDDQVSSHKQSGSFYGGRMPISSNLVKQTLSDKVSILSANHESKSHPVQEKFPIQSTIDGQESIGMQCSASRNVLPSIGIEPATPLISNQKTYSPMPQTILSRHSKSTVGIQHLSPTSSVSSRPRQPLPRANESAPSGEDGQQLRNSEKKDQGNRNRLSKKSDSEDDGPDPDDSSSQSSVLGSEKSRKPGMASKSSQTTSQSSKKKFKPGLKGHKGPGSQSSSSNLKSSSTKKGLSVRGSLRGSVPSAMKRGEAGITASVRMPDGEFVSVGGSLSKTAEADAEAAQTDPDSETSKSSGLKVSEKTPPKSSLKSATHTEDQSSTKPERRVSFPDPVNVSFESDEDHDETKVDVSDYDVREEETEDEGDVWPEVVEEEGVESRLAVSSESRPISSRSEKLNAHAQKVAALVVGKQRPDSRLDEDAKKAAELWNTVVEESGDSSEEEENWGIVNEHAASTHGSNKTSSIDKKQEKSKLDQQKKNLQTVSGVSPKQEPSIAANLSSVSSAQEAFVNEIQHKASDLGIEPTELEFHADVVHKLEKSDITLEEIEVIHDKKSGRHIVRSRSSSSVDSQIAPSTVKKKKSLGVAHDPAVPRQRLVVDLPMEKSSASRSRTPSVASSVTSHSPSSHHGSVSQRTSIPVDKGDVVFDYDVTTYKGRLGEPKMEEPTIQSERPRVEPEKIKRIEPSSVTKPDRLSETKPEAKGGDASSRKSDQSSTTKATGKQKQPTASTNRSRRKGQTAAKTQDKPEMTSSFAESKDDKQSNHTEFTKQPKKNDLKKKRAATKASDVSDVEKEIPEKVSSKNLNSTSPFRAGRAKEPKREEYIPSAPSPEVADKQESLPSVSKFRKGEKTIKRTKKKEPVSQMEKDFPKHEEEYSKEKPPTSPTSQADATPSPTKESETAAAEDNEVDYPEYVAPPSPEDTYEFVIREDTPEPELPTLHLPKSPQKLDDSKSLASEATAITEGTDFSSRATAQAAEDEAEREAKMAAKQEREQKRAAAAEKRRLEVERKRKEKEEQMRKEKEEQERQDRMKEELEAERRRREEANRLKREEAEREKQREKEEEESREKRRQLQLERERKQQEEYRRKMEELQRKKREEEERRREEAKRLAEEETARRKAEEEMMAQMEESEREKYAQKKKEEEEARKKQEEENRKRMEEEARVAMQIARDAAIKRAKEAAELEEKLRFIREFFTEANGMEQTQNVNRSFTFSYFELMRMLGLDVLIE